MAPLLGGQFGDKPVPFSNNPGFPCFVRMYLGLPVAAGEFLSGDAVITISFFHEWISIPSFRKYL